MSEPSDDLSGLVRVLVEAGILEPTGWGGYKAAIDVLPLQKEVEMLRRKVARLEAMLTIEQTTSE